MKSKNNCHPSAHSARCRSGYLTSLLVCVAIQFISQMTSSAALIAYEGFDFTSTGFPSGGAAGSGTGWANGWSANGVIFTGTGVTYSNASGTLSTTGNALTTTYSGYTTTVRTLSSAVTAASSSDGIVWVSFLANSAGVNGASGSGNYLNLKLRSGTTNRTDLGITYNGSSGASNSWCIFQNGLAASTGINAASNPLQLLVAKINLNTGTTALYLGTDLGVEPTTALATSTTAAFTSFDSVFIEIGGGAVTGRALDEIRIGTSYADVVPAPEPSSIALLLMASSLLLVRSRKRSILG